MTLRNLLRLLIAVVVLVQAPAILATTVSEVDLKAAPSKVCHPKKPVTCQATATIDDIAQTLQAEPQPEMKQAMVCVRSWLCRTDALTTETPEPELFAAPEPETKQAMVCVRSWLCRADALS